MKTIDLVEVRPGEWAELPKQEAIRRTWHRDWRILLPVHGAGFTLVMLLEHWLR